MIISLADDYDSIKEVATITRQDDGGVEDDDDDDDDDKDRRV